jgi:hypothetical protein
VVLGPSFLLFLLSFSPPSTPLQFLSLFSFPSIPAISFICQLSSSSFQHLYFITILTASLAIDTRKQSSAMKLTPIRMRGKRKSNRSTTSSGSGYGNGSSSSYANSDSDTAAATAALTLSGSSSPLKRSRASSPASQKKSTLSSSSTSVSASATAPAPARRARTKRPVPFDKRFPLEVIERIFFYSMNFNLPRASPRFGWMLSSRHTLRDLIFAAFGPQWNLTLTQKRYKRPLRRNKTGARQAHARVNDNALQVRALYFPLLNFVLVFVTAHPITNSDRCAE